jgi:hypothetical protein
MSGGLEDRPDVGMVVNLAVEHNVNGAVLVRERLMSLREIDDAQPTMDEARAVIAIESRLVRSSMREHIAHRGQTRTLVGVQLVRCDDSGNAAHV